MKPDSKSVAHQSKVEVKKLTVRKSALRELSMATMSTALGGSSVKLLPSSKCN